MKLDCGLNLFKHNGRYLLSKEDEVIMEFTSSYSYSSLLEYFKCMEKFTDRDITKLNVLENNNSLYELLIKE